MTKDELRKLPLEERKEYILNLLDGKTHNFAMFSKRGTNRCKSLIKKCIKKVMGKKAMRRSEFETYVSIEISKIAKQDKYGEIGDTAVREVIYYWLELAIEMADYDWHYDFEYSISYS